MVQMLSSLAFKVVKLKKLPLFFKRGGRGVSPKTPSEKARPTDQLTN